MILLYCLGVLFIRVHINRVKIAENFELWKPKAKQNSEKKLPRTQAEEASEAEDSVWKPRSLPLGCADYTANNREHESPPGQSPIHPITDTPSTDNRDHTYHPSESPRSRRELQFTETNLQLLYLQLEYYLKPI